MNAKTAKWRLKIVGEGDPPYVHGLRTIVSHHGIQEKVEFCGHLSGAAKYEAFQSSDLVVIPSFTENFGMVVAEALAHARPVIVSRGTPWREVASYGCGMWVNNDANSLASAIQQMAELDRVEMGLRGRKWMIGEFSWEERAAQMFKLYEELIT